MDWTLSCDDQDDPPLVRGVAKIQNDARFSSRKLFFQMSSRRSGLDVY